MKKTGELLKIKREAANLSISEIALATKINPKILTAIENGDESKLPAKTFLKGFVRSYALFLKMDVEEVLRSFQDEMGGPPPSERAPETQRQEPAPTGRQRVDDESSAGMRTAAVVVIVVLIGLIIGVRELIEKYQREKIVASPDSIKVSPLLQPPAEVSAVKPEVSATKSEPSAPQPNIPSAQPPPDPKLESAATPPTLPAPELAPVVPPPPPAPAVTAAIKPPEPPKTAPSTKPEPPRSDVAKAEAPKTETKAADKTPDKTPDKAPDKTIKNEIILEALDKVDVVMKIKGATKKVSLNATQVHTIHADQPVVFDFSDGGAVNIILNGHERGVPGDLGKPKQITIP